MMGEAAFKVPIQKFHKDLLSKWGGGGGRRGGAVSQYVSHSL